MQWPTGKIPATTNSRQFKRRETPVPSLWHNEWLTIRPLAAAIHTLSCNFQSGVLLDVGCGNKPYRAWFSNVNAYIGTDVTVVGNSEVDVVSSSLHLPFASQSFDFVICTQVIEHVEEPSQVMLEINRVLKNGGLLMLSAPMYWRLHEEPYDFYRYTKHGLSYLLKKNGFELIEFIQQGGAWRVVGQALVNTLSAAITFRTYGVKGLATTVLNVFFDLLDRVNYRAEDTANYTLLCRKTPYSI